MHPTTISQDFGLLATAVLSVSIVVNTYRVTSRSVGRAYRRSRVAPRVDRAGACARAAVIALTGRLRSRASRKSHLDIAIEF